MKNNNYQNYIFKQSKPRRYEYQIDKMAYELYGLTAEEIGIVVRTRK